MASPNLPKNKKNEVDNIPCAENKFLRSIPNHSTRRNVVPRKGPQKVLPDTFPRTSTHPRGSESYPSFLRHFSYFITFDSYWRPIICQFNDTSSTKLPVTFKNHANATVKVNGCLRTKSKIPRIFFFLEFLLVFFFVGRRRRIVFCEERFNFFVVQHGLFLVRSFLSFILFD